MSLTIEQDLDEKIKGLDERLKTQEFLSKGILVALIVAILGGLAFAARSPQFYPVRLRTFRLDSA